MNVYDELEGDTKNQTKSQRQNMDGSDSIVSMICIRKNILRVRTNSSINGMSRKKDMEHILERKADFESFKNGAQVIERTCNTIQSSISLWREYLEDIFENNQW